MEFDQFTVVLLLQSARAAELTQAEVEASQDAHMSHLADLHEAGHLLAAGPLVDEEHRGLVLFKVGPDLARKLMDADPAVQAGRFDVLVMPWMVPAGAMTFSSTHFPHSMDEVSG